MSFRNRVIPPAILVLLLITGTSMAQSDDRSRGFYLGARGGSADVEASLGDNFQQVLDGDEDSIAFDLGFRFGSWLALELSYHDLGDVPGFGSPCPGSADTCVEIVVPVTGETTAISLALVPILPLTERISVFGKAGLASWETDVSNAFDDISGKIDDYGDEDVIYGAGVHVRLLKSLGLTGEWERIASEIEVISFGVRLSF